MGRGTVALYGTTTTQAVCSAHTVRTLHAPCGYWMPLSPHVVTIQLCRTTLYTFERYTPFIHGCGYWMTLSPHAVTINCAELHCTQDCAAVGIVHDCHSNCATGGIHCAVNWHSTHTAYTGLVMYRNSGTATAARP